jgi:hypothetical protein
MAAASLTVGTVQVTAVCDVTADFPAPLERAFPEVEAMWLAPAHFPEPFGTVTREDGTRRWQGRR